MNADFPQVFGAMKVMKSDENRRIGFGFEFRYVGPIW